MMQSQNTPSAIHEEAVSFQTSGVKCTGYVTWDDNIKGKRPVVLVIPEWWGMNEYTKMRARMLAGLGYLAMAVDMYGDGKTAATPAEAQNLATPFYKNPQMSKTRIDAALQRVLQFPVADPSKTAAIGYCFGGSAVLNAAKLGSDLDGVVCFHGGLAGVPADRNLLKAKILVCNGGSDKFVPDQDIATFRHQLDSIGADYRFISYPGATHAFTNPASTENGKKFNLPIEYNEAGDKASWNDMKGFLETVFGTDPRH